MLWDPVGNNECSGFCVKGIGKALEKTINTSQTSPQVVKRLEVNHFRLVLIMTMIIKQLVATELFNWTRDIPRVSNFIYDSVSQVLESLCTKSQRLCDV